MKTSISIIPTWETLNVPITTTQLKVQIDVAPILNLLSLYDIYFVIHLIIDDHEYIDYSYTKLMRNITTPTISFNVTVMGVILSDQLINASCTAYFINK